MTSKQFDNDLEVVLNRAQRIGVRGIFVCATSQHDVLDVIKLRQKYPNFVHPCLGLHPLHISSHCDYWPAVREIITSEHSERGVAAIGEIGLDFTWSILKDRAAAEGIKPEDVKAAQVACFEDQLALAGELGLPVNVHSRNAERETLEILRRAGAHGIMHAYKGDPLLAVQAFKAGRLLFSFPPSIVYKREYQEAVQALPLEALLLETDSPSLAARGPKYRNEPSFIRLAAEKIAELKNVTVAEVATCTSKNAARILGASASSLLFALEPLRFSPTTENKNMRWRKRADQISIHPTAAVDNVEPQTSHVYNQPSKAGPDMPYEPHGLDVPQAVDADPILDRSSRRRGRWQRQSFGQAKKLDPTLCSSAFGIASCD